MCEYIYIITVTAEQNYIHIDIYSYSILVHFSYFFTYQLLIPGNRRVNENNPKTSSMTSDQSMFTSYKLPYAFKQTNSCTLSHLLSLGKQVWWPVHVSLAANIHKPSIRLNHVDNKPLLSLEKPGQFMFTIF